MLSNLSLLQIVVITHLREVRNDAHLRNVRNEHNAYVAYCFKSGMYMLHLVKRNQSLRNISQYFLCYDDDRITFTFFFLWVTVPSKFANYHITLLRNHSERRFVCFFVVVVFFFFLFFFSVFFFFFGVLFWIRIFCSDQSYLIKNHLSFLFLCFVIEYTERKKKRRVEFFSSYFNHFVRCLL